MSFDLIVEPASRRPAAGWPRRGAGVSADLLKRTWARFRHKLAAQACFGLAAWAVLLAAAYASAAVVSADLTPTIKAFDIMVMAAAALAALSVLIIASAASAAFKINGRRALAVGLTRLPAWLMTVVPAGLAVLSASLALVVPGLTLKLRFSLSLPVLLIEERRGAEALVRSRGLVLGRTIFLGLNLLLVLAVVAAAGTALAAAAGGLAGSLPADWHLPLLNAAASRWAFSAAPAAAAVCVLAPLPITFLQIFYEEQVDLAKPAAARPDLAKRYRLLAAIAAVLISLTAFGAAAYPWLAARYAGGRPAAATPSAAKPAVQLPPATLRDQQRYRAMNDLRLALNSYYHAVRSFPDGLSALVPAYLPSVPADPLTGKPYDYVRTASGYLVTFELEQGLAALAPGRHVLSPAGTDIPASSGIRAPYTVPASGGVTGRPAGGSANSRTAGTKR